MQLKQRIKKIEEKLKPNNMDSEFCGCWKKHWHSAVESAYNENPNIKIDIYPMPDFEKGFCDKCQKSISENDIKGHKDLVSIYGED